ncbi:MAG: chemotaxis protein CheA [Nitrospirales bacterium]|nr:MAG: chemotaxis protein CheA [Nitrospirales bacterium]
MNNMDAAITEFLIESDENVRQIETGVARLEVPPDPRLLSSLVRAIHTIKAACVYLGYTKLESLTQTGETLLQLVREGECELTSNMIGPLLAMVKAIRQMLERIEQEGTDGKNDYSELLGQLRAMYAEEVVADELASNGLVERTGETSMESDETASAVCVNAPTVNEPVRSDPELDEAVLEFLHESDESLSQVECDLVDIEKTPSQETLSSIFRVIHTIKGTCSFLGYAKLERLTHAGESLLSLIRDGRLSMTVERANALLSLVDAIRMMLLSIAQYRHDGTDEYEQLQAQLIALQIEESDFPANSAWPDRNVLLSSSPNEGQGRPPASGSTISPRHAQKNGSSATSIGIGITEQDSPASDEAHRQLIRASSIRVDVRVLDDLMTVVGELVLTRNQIFQRFGRQQDPTFLTTAQRLNMITAKLQEGLLKTRMQAIGTIWTTFPRVVRDLALACGKKIRIEMDGQETEFDKSLLEVLHGPLTHLVRNSVAHGVELATVREKNGKPCEGRLLLRAYHEGGQAHVEIADDGEGIHAHRVRDVAIARGVVTEMQVSHMQERELLELIFLPGFSTSSTVTSVSGRGVGLDVVKTNIEQIGGTITMRTECGKGTTFKLSVPLTLTIIPALIVRVAQERFAIPQVHLLEYVRIDIERHAHVIEHVDGKWMYRWRGELLPLLHLRHVLKLGSLACEKLVEPNPSNIVVLQAGGHRFGLVVETVHDIEEIVVKPLGKSLNALEVYAGMTIMGDGRIALILDAMGLIRHEHLLFNNGQELPVAQPEHAQVTTEKLPMYVVARVGKAGRVAIPVQQVMRIAKIHKQFVEVIDGQELVSYRNQSFSVVRVSSILQWESEALSDEGEILQAILVMNEGKPLGLVVDQIMDIVHGQIEAPPSSNGPGMLRTVVIQGNVTNLLDVEMALNIGRSKPVADCV